MIAFTDRYGRLWTGRLDVSAALRMLDLARLDVMSVGLGESLPDHAVIANAVFAIVLPQAQLLEVNSDEFGRCLRGWFRPAVSKEELAGDLRDEIATFFDVPELSPGEKGTADKTTAKGLWGAVYRMAAVAGVDPDRHTFGELVALADAKRKHDWSQTAQLIAKLHNVNCAKRSDLRDPAEFDPTGGLKRIARRGVTRIENTPDGAVVTEL